MVYWSFDSFVLGFSTEHWEWIMSTLRRHFASIILLLGVFFFLLRGYFFNGSGLGRSFIIL